MQGCKTVTSVRYLYLFGVQPKPLQSIPIVTDGVAHTPSCLPRDILNTHVHTVMVSSYALNTLGKAVSTSAILAWVLTMARPNDKVNGTKPIETITVSLSHQIAHSATKILLRLSLDGVDLTGIQTFVIQVVAAMQYGLLVRGYGNFTEQDSPVLTNSSYIFVARELVNKGEAWTFFSQEREFSVALFRGFVSGVFQTFLKNAIEIGY